jgi:hypothetical protein
MTHKQWKMAAAGVGAGAAVAMSIVGLTAEQPSSTSTFGEGPQATMGQTSTESAAPTELQTTFVTPSVTANKPAGFSDTGGGG